MQDEGKKLTEVITEIIILDAIPRDVYEAARDNQERFPNFMADVESIKILNAGNDNGLSWTITEWITDVDGTPLLWTEKDFFHGIVDGIYLATWKMQEGDFDEYEGDWEFVSHDLGCHVILKVRYDFGIPHLTNLIGPTLEKKVKENSQMMLEGLTKLVKNKPLDKKGKELEIDRSKAGDHVMGKVYKKENY